MVEVEAEEERPLIISVFLGSRNQHALSLPRIWAGLRNPLALPILFFVFCMVRFRTSWLDSMLDGEVFDNLLI